VEIQLAVQPPSFEGKLANTKSIQLPDGYFQIELVKRFGFLLDVEADSRFPPGSIRYSFQRPQYRYTQFVHRTGLAFIQLRETGRPLLWVNNRLLISHSQLQPMASTAANKVGTSGRTANTAGNAPSGVPATHPDSLRKQFQAFCADRAELSNFWDECLRNLTSATGLAPILDDVVDELAKRDEQLVIVKRDGPLASVQQSHTEPSSETTNNKTANREYHHVKSITVNVSSPMLSVTAAASSVSARQDNESTKFPNQNNISSDVSKSSGKRQRARSFQSLAISPLWFNRGSAPLDASDSQLDSLAPALSAKELAGEQVDRRAEPRPAEQSSELNGDRRQRDLASATTVASSTSLLSSSSWLFGRRSRTGSSSDAASSSDKQFSRTQKLQRQYDDTGATENAALEPLSSALSSLALWRSSSGSTVSRRQRGNSEGDDHNLSPVTTSPPVTNRPMRSVSSPSSPLTEVNRRRQQTAGATLGSSNSNDQDESLAAQADND
jgi:hypothetical protein